jgi:hypothetical protein
LTELKVRVRQPTVEHRVRMKGLRRWAGVAGKDAGRVHHEKAADVGEGGGRRAIAPEAVSEVAPADLAAAFGELRGKLPRMAEVLEPKNPGMHTTDTVDFDVVTSGEVYLELGDGSEVLLKAGDGVVQNGTRHAWRNRSPANCVIAVPLVLVGADSAFIRYGTTGLNSKRRWSPAGAT